MTMPLWPRTIRTRSATAPVWKSADMCEMHDTRGGGEGRGRYAAQFSFCSRSASSARLRVYGLWFRVQAVVQLDAAEEGVAKG